MNEVEWSKDQEKIFSGSDFGVSEKEYRAHERHYLHAIEADMELEKGDPILCIGCNDGAHVKEFCDAGYDAYGIDLPLVVENAKQKRPGLADRFLPCNLETEEIPKIREWKVVFVKDVIEHLVNWADLPRKISAAQPAGGMVWVATRNGDKMPKPVSKHFIHIPFVTLERIFEQSGYEVAKHYTDPLCGEGQILIVRRK